jgi:Family of unknown function (DUF5994)
MRAVKSASSSTDVPVPAVARRGDGSTDMTSPPSTSSRVSPAATAEDPRQPLRLRLKPKAPMTGFVDGGWWPWSRDLAAELPGLLAVLAVRLGPVERVSYHLADWGPTASKISVGGGVIRLGGYRAVRAGTVDVISARQRVTLLVVAPETSAATAHSALMAAGHRGNTDDVGMLLGQSHSPRRPR